MSVKATFTFDCGGCDGKVEVESRIESRFHSISGKDYGLGVYRTEWPDLEELAPDGWMAFDPYTRCTYCPSCVAEIWPEQSTEGEETR